ncbi:MAG TPA: ABC transporter permease [Ktedonobacteraceae bacterium]|jgi:osmoprotectant transport system permease protein|nr:ABC transporter permease [Ktedonobacteraceae bacterium]
MRYIFSSYNYDLSDPASIPNLFLQHLYLVGTSLIIAIIIAIPLGILISRYRKFYLPVIAIADILYTIPGIALVGILITLFNTGSATIIIPLVLYAQLVLIRNTTTAIDAIDPLLLEVGRAMGMNSTQLFFRVILPLAIPVIIAGIRIVTVTSIGIASLAALVGQGGLGTLVFSNLSSFDFDAISAGAILMAAFAVVADLVLLGVQTLLSRGRSVGSLA